MSHDRVTGPCPPMRLRHYRPPPASSTVDAGTYPTPARSYAVWCGIPDVGIAIELVFRL
jgi:hypothetical protein